MATYKLESVKGDRIIQADSLEDAIRAAIQMEEELQPAFGIGIKRSGFYVANVENGRAEIG